MKHWSLFDLDIIGFASILETPTLPRVLAPVFRDRKDPKIVVLPPFSLLADELFNATPATMAEIEALAAQEKLTLLGESFQARVNHDLWVNDKGSVAYEPKAAVKNAFGNIFTEQMALAEERLASRDYAATARHAAIARAVKPSHLDPLVIRAAAERLSGQHPQASFTRHIASSYVSATEFDRLVDSRTGGDAAADAHRADAMQGMAVRKSRFTA